VYDSWSTDAVDVRHQYDAWDEELSTVFGRWSVSVPAAMKFSASVECRSLDTFKVVECICDPCGASRGHADMLADHGDFLALQLVLDGYEQIRFAGEEQVELRAGDIFVWDSTKPMDFRVVERLHKISVLLPLARFRNWLPTSWQSIKRLIRPESDAGRLLAHYLAALSPRRMVGGLNNCDALIETTIGLLVNSQEIAVSRPHESQRDMHFERVRRYIAQHLTDAELTPSRVAEANRISLRYLHWLFEGLGTSVAQYIIRERLQRCRHELASPATNRRKVADIALSAGFNDVTHFSRRFKQEFGLSPRAFSKESAEFHVDLAGVD
jgi:AraC-like DNA-binding protein